MPLWPKDAKEFTVKVSYRASRTRGTLALPAPILQAWGGPNELLIVFNNDEAIVRPKSDATKSMVNSSVDELFNLKLK